MVVDSTQRTDGKAGVTVNAATTPNEHRTVRPVVATEQATAASVESLRRNSSRKRRVSRHLILSKVPHVSDALV
jgi:hypothetical protein